MTEVDETNDVQTCLVCLSELGSEPWSCTQCHAQCHLLCVLQWTIRSLVNSLAQSSFTCPNCRYLHHVDTLPGFQTESTRPTPRSMPAATTIRMTPISNPTTVDLFARAFGLVTPPTVPPGLSVRFQASSGVSSQEAGAPSRAQIHTSVDQVHEEEEESPDDAREEMTPLTSGLNIYASSLKIHIDTVHVNLQQPPQT